MIHLRSAMRSTGPERQRCVPEPVLHTLVVLVRDGRPVARWRLTGSGRPGLADVEVLARAHLVARRAGATLLLREPDPQLVELLEFVGLAGLAVEVGRESEHLEQPSVEEVVMTDDAVTGDLDHL
jgi:hypothetical protein